MNVIIDNYNFYEMDIERYWSLPKSKNPKIEIPNLVFGGEYVAARKIDGQFCMIIKDDNGEFYQRGRSRGVDGTYANKIEWMPQIVEDLEYLPNGTVLIGELYVPLHEGSKNVTRIAGCLKEKSLQRQQDEAWRLHFYTFDILALGGKNLLNTKLEDRIRILGDTWYKYFADADYIEAAEYYEGQELWDYIGEVLSSGGEGVVLQKKDSLYAPGKRTAWKTCKVKKEIGTELDLFFTGRYKLPSREYQGKEIQDWQYWLHKRTGEKMLGYYYDDFKAGATIEPISKGYYNGWAGSIELAAVDGNKIIPVAWISNITEDVREKVTKGEMNRQVVKVTCMEIDTESHSLRHAKIVEYRNDKSWKDCGIEQLY